VSPEPNPYAPPKHDGPASTGNSEFEAIRREHINAETNVKTIGALCYLGAASSIYNGMKTLEIDPVVGLISVVLGGAVAWGGYWLRRLDRRGRTAYTVVTALGMLSSLVFERDVIKETPGALLIAFAWPMILLAILWVEKASTVMTPHYRNVVIPATPHIQRKTSVIVIVLGVILILGLITIIVSTL
jgi:hypothetical protein